MFWKPSPVLCSRPTRWPAPSVNEVDFVQEFGIEDKCFLEFRATLGRSHKFRSSYVTFDYDAETTYRAHDHLPGTDVQHRRPATADINWKLYELRLRMGLRLARRGFFGVDRRAEIQPGRGLDRQPRADVRGNDGRLLPRSPPLASIGRGYLAPRPSPSPASSPASSFTHGDVRSEVLRFRYLRHRQLRPELRRPGRLSLGRRRLRSSTRTPAT